MMRITRVYGRGAPKPWVPRDLGTLRFAERSYPETGLVLPALRVAIVWRDPRYRKESRR